MEGPAGEPVLDLVLEGGSLTVRAKINGKNYRKLLKQVDEHGADNMAVALQGVLRPPARPGVRSCWKGRVSRRWSRRPVRRNRPRSRRSAEPDGPWHLQGRHPQVPRWLRQPGPHCVRGAGGNQAWQPTRGHLTCTKRGGVWVRPS